MTETTNSSEHNAVYKPSHYEKDGYPSTQVMVRAMFAGTEGKLPLSVYPWWKDAFKYLFRWPLKNGVEDLHKAKRCIDMILEELEASDQVRQMSEEDWGPGAPSEAFRGYVYTNGYSLVDKEYHA